MIEPPEDRFEKTFRMTCRLDDADIDYVRDTAEWIARCSARTLALNPSFSAGEVVPVVLDMSTRGHWRLMKPETVAEQLALPIPIDGTESVGSIDASPSVAAAAIGISADQPAGAGPA